MDKIEIGEWVRTNDGEVFEFGGYFKSGNIDCMTGKDGILYGNQQKCCKKHSKNKIDLVEVGDYVNGDLVYKITENLIYVRGKSVIHKHANMIKDIVTKEQFESVKYNFEEE